MTDSVTIRYDPLRSVTIRCIHCGPVRVDDPATVRYITGILAGLKVGHAPLGAITCPLCRDEAKSKDVSSC